MVQLEHYDAGPSVSVEPDSNVEVILVSVTVLFVEEMFLKKL